MSSMTFTTAYYVYIHDSSDVLSTDVGYDASTVSRSIATYVGERRTTVESGIHAPPEEKRQ
jgi:hypothetical protein